MEKIITFDLLSTSMIIIPILVIVIMEKFYYRKQPTPQKIESWQARLNKESQFLSKNFGIERKFDVLYEIFRERVQQKILVALILVVNYLTVLMVSVLIVPDNDNFVVAVIIGIVILIIFAVTRKNQFKKQQV